MGRRLMRLRVAKQWAAMVAVTVMAVTLAGCGSVSVDPTEWLSETGNVFSTPDISLPIFRTGAEAPKPRVITESDYVGADGQCQGGSPAATPGAPPPVGVALTMTECEVVAVAGVPEQVNIGADAGGARRTVLTYSKGDHAGIYTFVAGQLKIIERLPTPPKPERRRRRRS